MQTFAFTGGRIEGDGGAAAVCPDYEQRGLFPFTANIESVIVDLPDVAQPTGMKRLELATKVD